MFRFSKGPERPAVLLIDDDLVIREVMATLLTMSGYSVHTVESGSKALELLQKGACAPGVILADAQMPDLSGKELLDELRKLSQAILLVVSGSRPPDDVIRAADGFLPKPFSIAEMERVLNGLNPQATEAASAAENSGVAELPVLNPETLRKLREMMPEKSVRQIYFALLADLRRRMTALERAIDDGNDAEVRRIGHAIKGGCAVAGAERAAHLGERIEMEGLDKPSNQPDNKIRFVRELEAAAQDLQGMLETKFPSLL